MKKKLLMIISILIIVVILIVVMFKIFNRKENSPLYNLREKAIKNLGVTNDKQVIVKFKNEVDEESYYVFHIVGKGYIQYLYIFHDSKECYDDYVDKYITQPMYSLKTQEDIYLTIIKLDEASNRENIDIIEFLKNRYSDRKFKIIE